MDKDKHFTRNQTWTAAPLLQFNLCLIKQSTATEINNFFEKIDIDAPSKQSFGIARRKLKTELFEDAFKQIVNKYYILTNKAYKPKYRLKAFDSTTVQVPDSQSNREIFGAYSNHTCTYAATKLCAYFDISQHFLAIYTCKTVQNPIQTVLWRLLMI